MAVAPKTRLASRQLSLDLETHAFLGYLLVCPKALASTLTSCTSEHSIFTLHNGQLGALVCAIHAIVRNLRGHRGQCKVTISISSLNSADIVLLNVFIRNIKAISRIPYAPLQAFQWPAPPESPNAPLSSAHRCGPPAPPPRRPLPL